MKRLFEKKTPASKERDAEAHTHHHYYDPPSTGMIFGGLGLALAALIVVALFINHSDESATPKSDAVVREAAKQETLKQDQAKKAELAKVAAAKSEQAKKDLADRAEFTKECDGVGGKQLTKALSCTVFFEEPTAKPVAKRPHRRHHHWR